MEFKKPDKKDVAQALIVFILTAVLTYFWDGYVSSQQQDYLTEINESIRLVVAYNDGSLN